MSSQLFLFPFTRFRWTLLFISFAFYKIESTNHEFRISIVYNLKTQAILNLYVSFFLFNISHDYYKSIIWQLIAEIIHVNRLAYENKHKSQNTPIKVDKARANISPNLSHITNLRKQFSNYLKNALGSSSLALRFKISVLEVFVNYKSLSKNHFSKNCIWLLNRSFKVNFDFHW